MQEITLELGERGYPIFLGQSQGDQFVAKIKEMFGERSLALVTNTTIARLYHEQIAQWRSQLKMVVHEVPDGERYKTIGTWSGIIDTLLMARLDRRSVLIALGGGVVGDMTGFAAAAFLRGVDYVQVPTTLLAMVDSSVGGKTGVNHECGKNLIGAFHQPRLVWADLGYLRTLDRREYLCGYGEMFKNAFIGGPEMFAFIEKNHEQLAQGEPQLLAQAIKRSIEIKAAVVQSDELESGTRALLNFGHTFAHALEQQCNYEGILHGEAVLWGIACAIDLGIRTGTVAPADASRYRALLERVNMPACAPIADPSVLYDPMFSDKKTSGGVLHFVLPTRPGFAQIGCVATREQVEGTLAAVFGNKY